MGFMLIMLKIEITCGWFLGVKKRLKMTIEYVRNQEGHFVCPHKGCGKVCEKQNTMYYHVKRHMALNEKSFAYECSSCSMGFIQKSAFLHHMAAIHSDITDIQMKADDKKTIKNPYVGQEFKCPCCDNTTRTKANALVHYARLHAKDWIPSYDKEKGCTQCDKKFGSIAAYLYHCTGCIPATKKHRTFVGQIID
jgi:hypothetical protein